MEPLHQQPVQQLDAIQLGETQMDASQKYGRQQNDLNRLFQAQSRAVLRYPGRTLGLQQHCVYAIGHYHFGEAPKSASWLVLIGS